MRTARREGYGSGLAIVGEVDLLHYSVFWHRWADVVHRASAAADELNTGKWMIPNKPLDNRQGRSRVIMLAAAAICSCFVGFAQTDATAPKPSQEHDSRLRDYQSSSSVDTPQSRLSVSTSPNTLTLFPKRLDKAAAHGGRRIYGISRYYLRKPLRTGVLLGCSRMPETQIPEGIWRLKKWALCPLWVTCARGIAARNHCSTSAAASAPQCVEFLVQ